MIFSIIILLIIAYPLLENYTLKKCNIKISKAFDKTILKIGKLGYKVNKDKISEMKDGKLELVGIKKNKLSMFIQKTLMYIPFINLLVMDYVLFKDDKTFIKEALNKNIIIPMDINEKKIFNELNNNEKKINYLIATTFSNEDTIIMGYNNDKPVLLDTKLIPLVFDKLVQLSYNLDEVKKLNQVLGGNYKLCEIPGKKIAIIGLFDKLDYSNFKRVRLFDENECYTFKNIDEKDAHDMHFVVYPFMLKNKDKLDLCIEEIRENRKQDKEKRFTLK